VLPDWREVVGAEDSVKDSYKEVDRALREMLQSPVRDTVRAWSLAEFEAPDGLVNLFGAGQLGFAGRGLDIRLQRSVDHFNNSRDRMNGNRLELNFQTVSNCLGLFRV